MFIMIHESGDMLALPALTEDDLSAAKDGVVTLIRISDVNTPETYIGDEWVMIPLVDDPLEVLSQGLNNATS